MANAKRIEVSEGRTWFLGFHTQSFSDVIVPISQVNGLTDEELGKQVRQCVPSAIAFFAECFLDEWRGWLEHSPDERLYQYFRMLEPYQELTWKVGRVLGLILDEMHRRALIHNRKYRVTQSGYVYLAYCETGHYKIGMSKTPNDRIRHFDTQMPVEVSLVCTIQTDDVRGLESELHKRFDKQRVNGEWFELSNSDVDSIVAIAD